VRGNVGVNPGDTAVTIDGQSATEVLAAREALIPGSTPQCIRARALDQLMTRVHGDKIRLELESDTQPGVRRTVTVDCTTRAEDLHQLRPPNLKELEPGIFYVDLARLTDADFSAAIPSLVKARGIVFDMRDRPNQTVDFFQYFRHLLNQPIQGPPQEIPVVTKPDRKGMTFERNQWQVTPVTPYFGAKKAFLTNGRDISYAETILGMVERYKLAEIVGEATAGTNGVINPFRVPGGYEITWTGLRVLKHDGSPLFGVGILPTIPVSLTRAGIAAGRDEVLEHAVHALKE
jgi:C-terminal processing protease CtpA/Prc